MASNLALPPLPDNFKPVGHLLKTANEHETRDPVVAYWARLSALQSAMVIDKKSKEAKAVLIPLMDWLEKEKKVLAGNEAVTSEIVASAHIENYAMRLFTWADKEDRASKFGKNVVKAFYTAGNLFDILQVFGELTPEVAHARKYSKWKAAYIHNCLKNGQQPVPGPIGGEDEEEDEGVVQPSNDDPSGASGGGWSLPEAPVQPTPQPRASKPPSEPVAPPATEHVEEEEQPNTGSGLAAHEVIKVQKLCKFASSALDYDDVNAAIKNLTEALTILQQGKR